MTERQSVIAVYLKDGMRSESQFWEQAPVYVCEFSRDRNGTPKEGGKVWFGWNEAGLYVSAKLDDSYIIATGTADEQLHFLMGDVFELFVKPLNDSYYWEMYATPAGKKSTLFFPRERAEMTTDDFLTGHNYRSLEVRVRTTSSGWDAELFVPAKLLTALGTGWEPNVEWTVFCGRYNYSNDELKNPELSMVPSVSKTNYHLTGEYALLKLCPPESQVKKPGLTDTQKGTKVSRKESPMM